VIFILDHYKLLINTGLLTDLLPILGVRAAMWVNPCVFTPQAHKGGFTNTLPGGSAVKKAGHLFEMARLVLFIID